MVPTIFLFKKMVCMLLLNPVPHKCIVKSLKVIVHPSYSKLEDRDIKRHNVLLDSKFKAKISDFGLARLFDGDQSHATTTCKGTHGYMAPELLPGQRIRITEKADVYSFGVVVMEMMCGRKNLESSVSEEIPILLHLVKSKADDYNLLDLVDKNSDMELNGEKAVHMMRIAIWCLQSDYATRPSMSMVVKVLEGVMDMEVISDYSFLTLRPWLPPGESTRAASVPSPSILSGPR